jgi:hypothetical protein
MILGLPLSTQRDLKMKVDLEYWQEDSETITVEPKNFEAQSVMNNQFPLYKKPKTYASYLSFGTMRWVFPCDSSQLYEFLDNTELSSQKISQELSFSAK